MVEAPSLEQQAETLFKRDPLLGALTIVVAANALPGAAVTDIETEPSDKLAGETIKLMLPDWGLAEWTWWIDMCLGMAQAMEGAKPEGAASDSELENLRRLANQARQLVRPEPGVESEDGPLSGDDMGWLAWAGKVLMAGGRLLKSQSKRIGKWAAPYVKQAAIAGWDAAKTIFKKAPKKITTALILLLTPGTAAKILNTAGEMAGKLFGRTVKGVLGGIGPLGLAVIAAALYFAFGGKGAAD